ncbi:hypothetical protein PCASD_08771 [Puccinia coronata f. sp. avenae]|uniref:Uncharacterized protein n=1 Tax=Puccinia coronata f. sp. avenae TaxID=200324 RepID=A0A2N5UPF6_9BASI|nr:hypothetical protein PCASD_08771 [Puccinia coronata f. sp. avenae]
MPSSIMLDPRPPSKPQCHTSSSGAAPQAEPKLLSIMQTSSPSSHVRPSDAGAESHRSRIHFHQKQSHASNENQPIGNHRDSNLNSAPQAKGFQTSHSKQRSPSQSIETQRFSPYFNPQRLDTLPKLSTPFNHSSDKFSKPRKRTVILKPKFPKYAGSSNLGAPSDLVSDMIPGSHPISLDQSNSPASKSISCLTPEKMSRKQLADSITIDDGQNEDGSSVPIDFLKRLDFHEWDQRKRDLLQMVESRKNLFLQNGFAETSGKPFLPDDPTIQKKPIPNRWVWYMHLSTDYDKAKSTRVPAGGPAGYLKYGWDRLGVAGKQPYQELTDIYSAQRLKFMAEHGIAEDTTKKKSKQSDKSKARKRPSQKEAIVEGDKHQMNEYRVNEQLSPRSKISFTPESIDGRIPGQLSALQNPAQFMPVQSILQPNLLYDQVNRFPLEKAPYDYVDGAPDIFEMNEAPCYSSYLQSPDLMPTGFSPLGYDASTYGHRYNSESTADQLNTPLGYPSSPTEYPFACNLTSTFPYQAASEFQAWSTLSPESINSGRSETVGVFPQACMSNTLPPPTTYTSLAPSNAFLEPFNDLNPLHPGNNY